MVMAAWTNPSPWSVNKLLHQKTNVGPFDKKKELRFVLWKTSFYSLVWYHYPDMPWCTILDRFGGNFCEKNIPQFFCKKIDCGLWLRHGIMSLFNAQQSFVELEVIFRGVKNSGNQKFNKRHYEILSHLMNCQTIDWLYKTVLRQKKIFLC